MEGAWGMKEVTTRRYQDTAGILNGIDLREWDPRSVVVGVFEYFATFLWLVIFLLLTFFSGTLSPALFLDEVFFVSLTRQGDNKQQRLVSAADQVLKRGPLRQEIGQGGAAEGAGTARKRAHTPPCLHRTTSSAEGYVGYAVYLLY